MSRFPSVKKKLRGGLVNPQPLSGLSLLSALKQVAPSPEPVACCVQVSCEVVSPVPTVSVHPWCSEAALSGVEPSLTSGKPRTGKHDPSCKGGRKVSASSLPYVRAWASLVFAMKQAPEESGFWLFWKGQATAPSQGKNWEEGAVSAPSSSTCLLACCLALSQGVGAFRSWKQLDAYSLIKITLVEFLFYQTLFLVRFLSFLLSCSGQWLLSFRGSLPCPAKGRALPGLLRACRRYTGLSPWAGSDQGGRCSLSLVLMTCGSPVWGGPSRRPGGLREDSRRKDVWR